MARVFLSHAASDRPRVRRLAEGLRRAGHQPWLIEDELRIGRSVLDVLQHGLHDSDFVVVCLSREALHSGWQEAELRLILEGLHLERADRLLPIRFEEVELPASLQGRPLIDVLEDHWDQGVTRLAALLRGGEEVQSESPQQMRTVPLRAPGPRPPLSEEERVFPTGLALYEPESGPGVEQLQRALVLARSDQVPPAEVSHALSDALRAANEGGSTGNAARATLMMGAVLGSRGAWESAQEHLERALRLSKQSGNDGLVAEAYRLLGDANLHGSHYEDARLNYAEAIRRFDALGLLRKAAKTRLLLLTMLLQLGRFREIDSLRPPLLKALNDGLFTDMQERADVELALRLAGSPRAPWPHGDTP
ncbi:toll/interleukin-1 receptor domain-containing protein [Cystobacter fuscus]|uniref:toll/interleukin-1 receptor domain-containing protein n=1 Tax=Cystobacter fuscus TaxID=43 RepID=UPI002B2B8AC4|nr:toll/interleukin-1 receptor domain-containing protein [Cystobacter fuscus]